MATWRMDLQRWSWAEGNTDPIRYCFVDPPPGGDHPARAWTEQEKAAARHAIEEWNKALKDYAISKGRSNMERIAESDTEQPCDITLRWEDDSFFKNYQVRTQQGSVDHGLALGGTPGYADRLGGGSLEQVRGNSLTPFTPGRDTTRFPRGEIYFNTSPFAAIINFQGWFVDPTPGQDEEFEEVESDTIPPYRKLRAKRDGPAARKIDFYTAAKHEFGHMLGLDHNGRAGANGDRGQVMAGGVGAQERRHQLPILKWMEEERRHLTSEDLDMLHKHYWGEFEYRALRRILIVAGVVIAAIVGLILLLN